MTLAMRLRLHRSRRARLLAAWGAAAALSALAPGCGLQGGLGGASAMGQESIFTLFPAPPSPAEAAQWAIDPYNADKRQRGVLLLANAPFGGEAPYLRLYELRLDDEDAAVRMAAVKALALHGEVRHVAALAARLREDSSPLVRREAARALQRLHDPALAPAALLRALSPELEADADTRAAAAIALGQYAQPTVVQGLIGALADRQLRVNEAAKRSLNTLTGERFGLDIRAWLSWSQAAAAKQALFANRKPYVYPVFQRDPTIAELILPWLKPPRNETPAPPVGAPDDVASGAKVGSGGNTGAGGPAARRR